MTSAYDRYLWQVAMTWARRNGPGGMGPAEWAVFLFCKQCRPDYGFGLASQPTGCWRPTRAGARLKR